MSEISMGSAGPAPASTNTPLQIGSSMVPLYVDRKMKLYLVTESEFESLSSLNGQATGFSAVGSAMLSLALSIWINAIFYTEIPPAAYVVKVLVAPLLVFLAIVFFVLAYSANKSRNRTWTTIKTESGARASSESASPNA